MTSRDFCFWLQGCFEITDAKALNEWQLEVVKRHLALVFKHEIDPSMTPVKVKQDALDAIHNDPSPGVIRPPGVRC
jgi:hypothetical protein